MSFLEDLISRAFLSNSAATVATKGFIKESGQEETPLPIAPAVQPGYSGKGNKMNIGFIVYGVRSPVIKLATMVNGKEYRTTVIKDANLKINANTPDITVSRPNIKIEVSNVSV